MIHNKIIKIPFGLDSQLVVRVTPFSLGVSFFILEEINTHKYRRSLSTYHSGYKRRTTHRVSSTVATHPDGTLKNMDRKKILHYRQLYVEKTDPIIFLTVTVNTSG